MTASSVFKNFTITLLHNFSPNPLCPPFADFGRMAVFHQQLGELTTYKYSALVNEATYSDFLNPKKLNYYKPSFTAKAIGEIHAMHPVISSVATWQHFTFC